MNDCHDNATCVDNEGSYDCECKEGFSGSGVTCAGMNPFTVDLIVQYTFTTRH